MDQDREQKLAFAESTSCVADRLFQLQSLQSENTSLRRQVTTNIYQIPSGSDYPDPSSPSALKRRQSSRASRPMSMYETGSGLKPYLPKGETPYPEEGIPTLQPFPPHVSKTCSLLSFAISSPLPCFHHCPSCLHPVCKPFFLPFFIFSLIVFLPHLPLSAVLAASKTAIKKTKQRQPNKKQKISPCRGLRCNQSRLLLSRYIFQPLLSTHLLFTGVLLVCQTIFVVH